jgi:putative membrane protein
MNIVTGARAAALAFACAFAAAAGAQDPSLDPSVPPTPATAPSDSDFLRAAAQIGMAEIELGDLAFTKAETSELRTLGKALADEHRAINSELYSLATQEDVAMPGTLDAVTRGIVNDIANKDGEEFDRAFLSWLDAAHVSQANLYDRQMRLSADEDVRRFARKFGAEMLDHLNRVRSLVASNAE